jgi:hypothetical protein
MTLGKPVTEIAPRRLNLSRGGQRALVVRPGGVSQIVTVALATVFLGLIGAACDPQPAPTPIPSVAPDKRPTLTPPTPVGVSPVVIFPSPTPTARVEVTPTIPPTATPKPTETPKPNATKGERLVDRPWTIVWELNSNKDNVGQNLKGGRIEVLDKDPLGIFSGKVIKASIDYSAKSGPELIGDGSWKRRAQLDEYPVGWNNIIGTISSPFGIDATFIADRSLVPLPRGGWLNVMAGWGASLDNKPRLLFSIYAIDNQPLAMDLVKPDGSRIKYLGFTDLLPGAPIYTYGKPANIQVERIEDGTLTLFQDGIAVRRGNLAEITKDCRDGTIGGHIGIYMGGTSTSSDASDKAFMIIDEFKIKSLPK